MGGLINTKHTYTLIEDFPRLFSELDGFECGDEHFDTIYGLSSALCALANKGYKPEDMCFDEGDGIYPRITQIKIKYGELRVYAYALSKEMRELINAL